MYVQNLGYILSIKIGGPKATYFRRFSTTSQLNGTATECLWNVRNMTQQIRFQALETTKGLLYFRKISWTSVHKRLKIRPEFLHTLR